MLVCAGVGPDERLATAKVEAGCSVLVGHGPRKAQDIGECRFFGRMGPYASSAQGGAQGGVMNSDKRPEPSVFVHRNNQLLIIAGFHDLNDFHSAHLRLLV